MLYSKFLICTLSCNWYFFLLSFYFFYFSVIFFFISFFFFSEGRIVEVITELYKRSYHEGHRLLWTKGIIDVGFDVAWKQRSLNMLYAHKSAVSFSCAYCSTLHCSTEVLEYLNYWGVWILQKRAKTECRLSKRKNLRL